MITKVFFVINIITRDQFKVIYFILADYSSKPQNLKKTNLWDFIQQVLEALLN